MEHGNGTRACQHIEVNPAVEKVTISGCHLGGSVRMHVDRLNCHQRAQCLGVFNDYLRNQPWISDRVIGVNQYASVTELFAPTRNINYALKVRLLWRLARLRASGEDLQRYRWLLFLRSFNRKLRVHK